MVRKLTRKQGKKIRRLYSTGNYKQQELADIYGVTRPNISYIVNKKTQVSKKPPKGNYRSIFREGNTYYIYDDGRIWSVLHNKLLSPQPNSSGHLYVSLGKGYKTYNVAILVLRLFKGPQPSKKHEACHNNGDPTDNHIKNLRWDLHKINMQDMYAHDSIAHGKRYPGAVIGDKLARKLKKDFRSWYRLTGISRWKFFEMRGKELYINPSTVYSATKRTNFKRMQKLHRKRLGI